MCNQSCSRGKHINVGHCNQTVQPNSIISAMFIGMINLSHCIPLSATLTSRLGQISLFFFCGRSAVLRPSVLMLPGAGQCGAGLPPFPTACWWLAHPAAITGVSVSARWNSPGECGGPSVLLRCHHSVESMMLIRFRYAHRLQCPVRKLNVVVCSCLARQFTGSVEGL